MPEDRFRHEILDGVHVMSPSPDEWHQDAVGRLYLHIQNFLDLNPLGQLFVAPFDVRLSDHDLVVPDLTFVAKARLAILTGSFALGAPDLAVEVLSPSNWRQDLGKKRARYEHLGVGEYWVLDRGPKSAMVFRRQGPVFLPPIVLSAESGDRLTTPLLPGLEIPLSDVYRYSKPEVS
jgi:Uma2 family endonuclease